MDVMMTDYEILEAASLGAAGAQGIVGKVEGGAGPPVEERAVVTVALKDQQTGQPLGERYRLRKGESMPLTGNMDKGFEIDGPYELTTLRSVPTYATVLSVSKNPGVPVVSLYAALATNSVSAVASGRKIVKLTR